MLFQDYFPDKHPSWLNICGKAIFLFAIIYLSTILIFFHNPWIFLDGVNLLIHESGHLIFKFGGETISMLGGTTMQLLVPSLFLFYFIKRSDLFSSSFCIFWIGDNFVNISVYIKDARAMVMPLVGGGTHDWNTLLTKWNLLESNILIGNVFYILGVLFLVASIIFMLLDLMVNVGSRTQSK